MRINHGFFGGLTTMTHRFECESEKRADGTDCSTLEHFNVCTICGDYAFGKFSMSLAIFMAFDIHEEECFFFVRKDGYRTNET